MGVMTEDGNKKAGWKEFPRPMPLPRPPQNFIFCSISHLGFPPLGYQVLRSDTELCTWGWINSIRLHKPQHHRDCSQLPLASTAPSAWCSQSTHHLPCNDSSRRWQAAFSVSALTCQTSPQALQKLTIQNPIPNRPYNFIQMYHLLSQNIYVLTLQMPASPLSDQFLCLYGSPTHGEKYFVVTEFSVLAKRGLTALLPMFAQPAC